LKYVINLVKTSQPTYNMERIIVMNSQLLVNLLVLQVLIFTCSKEIVKSLKILKQLLWYALESISFILLHFLLLSHEFINKNSFQHLSIKQDNDNFCYPTSRQPLKIIIKKINIWHLILREEMSRLKNHHLILWSLRTLTD